jgi:hypothetical protein
MIGSDMETVIDTIRNAARLQRENAELRDALDWYAQSSNWRREVRTVGGKRLKWVKSPAAFDRGARAKFVILTLEGAR